MALLSVGIPASVLQVSNIHELGLVTCSLDSTIKITDLSRCKVLHTVTAHRRGVHCFAHSKAFSLCASGGLERDILLWQGSTNRQVGEMTGHAASISHLAIDNRRCQVQANDAAVLIRHYTVQDTVKNSIAYDNTAVQPASQTLCYALQMQCRDRCYSCVRSNLCVSDKMQLSRGPSCASANQHQNMINLFASLY